MAKIARATQLIFASSATNNGVFGSAQASGGTLSNVLATIMGLPAWESGWLSATIGANDFPPLEEMQSLNYVNTTQLAYLFQEGISEYDAGTTYFHYSIVKAPGSFTYFGSLIDTNLGNTPSSSPSDWVPLTGLSPAYASAQTTIVSSANNVYSFTHGLGATPAAYKFRLHCLTAELGYSVGDEVQLSNNSDGDVAHGSGSWANATTVNYVTNQLTPLVYSRSSNVMAAITAANWKIIASASIA